MRRRRKQDEEEGEYTLPLFIIFVLLLFLFAMLSNRAGEELERMRPTGGNHEQSSIHE